MVEQRTVNALVVGSSPTPGAKQKIFDVLIGGFLFSKTVSDTRALQTHGNPISVIARDSLYRMRDISDNCYPICKISFGYNADLL